MASKYDTYWLGEVEKIRAAVHSAASGRSAEIDVEGLRRCGSPRSWYGSVEVRARESGKGSAAHLTSLGAIVAASDICAPWPDRTFRLSVTQSCVLVIKMAETTGSHVPIILQPTQLDKFDIQTLGVSDTDGNSQGEQDAALKKGTSLPTHSETGGKTSQRRLVIAVIVIVIILVGLPIVGYRFYQSASATPQLAPQTGGLYLVINKPNVEAHLMEVTVSEPDNAHPTLQARVYISDPHAKYALVGQGSFAFHEAASGPHVKEYESARFEPAGSLFVGQVAPSSAAVVYVPRVLWNPKYPLEYPSQYITVIAKLDKQLASDGAGRSRGKLPPILAGITSRNRITGISGFWYPPLPGSTVRVSVSYDSPFDQIDSAYPHTATPGNLTWSTNGGNPGGELWESSDPDAFDKVQRTIFFLGIAFGIWGAAIVASGQFLLSKFLKTNPAKQ